MAGRVEKDLVLVGGGHAHVQVMRRFMMAPLPGVRLSVVLDRPEAVYSGMVPGFVSGDYPAEALEIDGVPLARRAGARVLLAPAIAIDPAARRIALEGRPDIAYDVASLDVGSTVRGLELPGVSEHTLATRPIRSFVDHLEARLDRAQAERGDAPLRIAVVGAGSAGTELAFSLEARLRAAARPAELTLLADSREIGVGLPARAGVRLARLAEARGIRVRAGVRVVGAEKDRLILQGAHFGEAEARSGEEPWPCDLAVWATGAAPPALLAASALPLDAQGFVRVRSTLQVLGHDDLFAVGDCATLEEHPALPKAGVFAVREGPVLDANLRARLTARTLRRYRPQRDFLALLNLGERRALGAKWGMSFTGHAVWQLKDRIDRRFMARFRVLDAAGAPSPGFPSPEAMGGDGEEMECGGCAAKVSESALTRALARLEPPPHDPSVRIGLGHADDAAALALPGGDLVLASIDAFRAFCDDPWLVGRVAAVNAVSDVLAKGGEPRHALALVTVPERAPDRAEETLYQVLAGIRAALDPLGASLVGGHSTGGDELFVGLTITGSLADGAEPLPLDGLRPGQRLLLTKPLGTGVLLAADMRGLARGEWVRAAHASMLRSNQDAARVARAARASACTDVSGFGLAGHLGSMLRASGVGAVLEGEALPALEGALDLLARGLRSSFHEQNRRGTVAFQLEGEDPWAQLVVDPQTSGGLLFAVEEERAAETLAALHEAGDTAAAAIGRVVEARAGTPPLALAEAHGREGGRA